MSPVALFKVPVRIRRVSVDRSSAWLAMGWRDLRAAPAIGLAYGAGFVAVSFLLTFGLIAAGLGALVLPLAGGFLLVAPVLVVGLYDVSRRLERGQSVSVAAVLASLREAAARLGAMGVVLTIFMLAWVLIALALFALFFGQAPPPLDRFVTEIVFSLRGAVFLAIGTAVGTVLAAVAFAITAVSVPMLLDRDLDVVSAIYVSVKAVEANRRVMFGWAAMIVLLVAVGMATFYVGLAVVMPLLAFATWHAYRDLVEPDR